MFLFVCQDLAPLVFMHLMVLVMMDFEENSFDVFVLESL
jgi:hypothetical protein